MAEEVGTHVAEDAAEHALADGLEHAVEDGAEHAGTDAADRLGDSVCKLSFAPETLVAVPAGERAIGSLKVGDSVTAYDPSSGTTSTQTVQHVFINHDNDLLDVTLASSDSSGQQSVADAGASKQQEVAVASHGLRAPPATHTSAETIHTTMKHPWLTTDKGWVLAGQLVMGERVVREDGSPAIIVGLRVVAGAADYYNLTVSQLHTYAVGTGQYVVHNCPEPGGGSGSANSGGSAGSDPSSGGVPEGHGNETPPNLMDPAQPPGPDFQWRGTGDPSSGRGAWYNPTTKESWHPDLEHGPPEGPHWDFTYKGMGDDGYPDGWRWDPTHGFRPK